MGNWKKVLVGLAAGVAIAASGSTLPTTAAAQPAEETTTADGDGGGGGSTGLFKVGTFRARSTAQANMADCMVVNAAGVRFGWWQKAYCFDHPGSADPEVELWREGQ
ncbi:hypothetical protein AB0P21_19760 [Kribbella sp. NPDC056861]|uniref:hypothetical protein n=1 Tax=Kribbella sp. NPDC056861 TaxID=3154857 RepID=UPI003426D7A1